MKDDKFILWFEEIGIEDVPLVGGKNASLGEMIRELKSKGVSVPNGFAITATAYKHLLKSAGIEDEIKKTLRGLADIKKKDDALYLKELKKRGKK